MTRRRRVEVAPSLNITSMLDMFTIILVFLLNFLDPDQDSSAGLSLPETAAVEPGRGEALLVVGRTDVRVGPAGAQQVVPVAADGSLDAERLARTLQELRGSFPESGAPLVVAVDKGVTWAAASRTLGVASEAGFGDFRFVAVKGAETAKP